MSRFFRSADSSSSSEDEDEEDIASISESIAEPNKQDADTALSNQTSALSILDQSQTGRVNQSSPQWTSHHKDVLLHALLEDWCLNETAKQYEGTNRDAPPIQAEARARYLRLVSQLAPLDVLPANLASDQHGTTRQRYRDVLGVFDRQNAEPAMATGARRLLTDGSSEAVPYARSQGIEQLVQSTITDQPTLQAPLRRLLGHADMPSQEHGTWSSNGGLPPPQYGQMLHAMSPAYGQTRYQTDFEELSILGKGGYGIVYHARNRLDNQVYAVKKVPLSAARLHRIRARGQSEVDEILLELRTLARLHHPNIVRYYNAWVEWTDGSIPGAVESPAISDDNQDSSQAVAGADKEAFAPARRFFTEDDIDGHDIVFENSGIESLPPSENSASESKSHDDSGPNELQRTRTRSTIATASDETVESIDRQQYDDVSASIRSTADGAQFAHGTLAVHMQMSLHPMTLADLLASSSKDGNGDALRHCYHLEPAVAITSAVLDGLEYLHDEGIIHRDIKPANIFLSPAKSRGPRRAHTSVNLRECSDCGHGKGACELDICIGDFGLAAVASPQTEETGIASPSDSGSPVGTAIYRPPPTQDALKTGARGLDIYALGVVLFELLCEFATRMERLQSIRALKEEGRYPEGFGERIGRGRGGKMVECVDCMLAGRETMVEVRERLAGLIEPIA